MAIKIGLKEVKLPVIDNVEEKVFLTDETIQERKEKVLARMEKAGLSAVAVYADKEHGGSFEYLVGFIPRFEEALFILNADGTSTTILGNENFNKAKFSRVETSGVKCGAFSLPNQPMQDINELPNLLNDIEIDQTQKVGLVGWKMIPGMVDQFDVPQFIVKALADKVGNDKLVNATDIYIGPENGARVTNNANEIAHYEYGASLASDSVLEALNALAVDKTEIELGEILTKHGQYNNVVTIAAFGERFTQANIYPTNRKLEVGDKVALTVSYKGGLSSRTGYAVNNLEEAEATDKGYIEDVVKPYFKAYNFWLENIEIGKSAGEFYDEFNAFYPQETFGWELCPGHLTADEEWMSSPFYKDSKATIQSGMLFQVDFIPVQAGHQGVSAESTMVLADETLREEIKSNYPELWARIVNRRQYLKEELNIDLKEEILPLASTLGYYRPFMLNKDVALYIESK